LNTTVVNFLAGVTLAQLVQKQRTQPMNGPASFLKMHISKPLKSRSRADARTTPIVAI